MECVLLNKEEEGIVDLAKRSLKVRTSAESYRWTPEMIDGHAGFTDEIRTITEQEARLFKAKWKPESAFSSGQLMHQRDVLAFAVGDAVKHGVDVLVFVVWDGVPLRMALAAGDGEGFSAKARKFGRKIIGAQTHWDHTEIRPCIGEFPAMTNWGHLRLLHGVGLERGLPQSLNQDLIPPNVPLASFWQSRGQNLGPDWVSNARESLVMQTSETLSPLLNRSAPCFGGYTGVRLANIQSNVLDTLLMAMEDHGTLVIERGERAEKGQMQRLQNVLACDRDNTGFTLAFSRVSFDSRGAGGQDHLALNFSGHEYGPYNPAAVSGLRRSWNELCEVVKNSLRGRKAMIVACSDHGMTPCPNTIQDTWAQLAPGLSGSNFLPEVRGRTPWFSERGAVGPNSMVLPLNTLIQQTSAMACSIDSAQIPNTELTAMSLRHGWAFGHHRGEHGGIGFDDIVIPLMIRNFA